MENLLKKLFGQSSTYALGKILTKGVGLLLLPLYTRYLSTEDYGILAVASVVISLLGTALTGGARGAALKFYFEYEGIDRRRFYGSLTTTLVFGTGVLFFLVDAFGETIFGVLFNQVPYHPYIRMALWTGYLTSVFVVTTKEMMKASERALVYTGINVAVFAVSTAFTIWWVVFEGQGAEGAIRGKLVGAGIVGLACGGYLLRYIRPAFDVSMIKRAFLYSLPLVPHFLSHWVLSAADRVLLERMVPLSEVGVYNVGYKIGAAMSFIAASGNNAIIPLYGNLDIKDSENISKVARVFTYYLCVVLFIGVCISLFGEELVIIATPREYHSAGGIIPLVVLGYSFMAIYYSPTNILTITLEKSKVVGIATIVGAISNVILNIIFIPIIGIYGAAITTSTTYAIMFAGVYFMATRSFPVPVEPRRTAKLLVAACFIFGLAWLIAPEDIIQSILLKSVILLLFPFCLWLLSFYSEKEIEYAKSAAKNLVW